MIHPLRTPRTLLVVGQAGTDPALPQPFRVCSWNWHKCTHPHWAQDFTALCRQCDLFLAQEARLSPSTCQLLAQSNMQWNAAISFLSPVKHIPTGLAAGCRVAAQEITCQSGAREPIVRIPKMMMKLMYPLAKAQLLVLHLHAINFTGTAPFELTLQKAAQFIAPFQGPVLLAGDFNTWSQKRIDLLRQLAAKLQLQEVLFSPDLRTRYLKHPVDYLFTRGLDTLNAKVLTLSSSDHHPLLATFRLANNSLKY